MRSLVYAFLVVLGIIPQASALEVLWQSASGGTDLRHDGITALDESFQAEVGSFESGFVPSALNVELWEENWRSFGTTNYNSEGREIRGTGDLANNDEFQVGEQAYLWVWNSKTGSEAEWLLVRNESWTWPSVSPLSFSFNIVLSRASGADIIFGRANQESFQIQTRRPFRGTWNYAAWLPSEFTSALEQADPSISGRMADPDGDGLNNLFEFVMGTNPKVRNFTEYQSPLILTRENGEIRLEVIRDPLAVIGLEIGVSQEMNDQFPFELPESTTTVEWSDRRIYRFPLGVRDFYRVELEE